MGFHRSVFTRRPYACLTARSKAISWHDECFNSIRLLKTTASSAASLCEVAALVRMLGGHQGGKSAPGSRGRRAHLPYATSHFTMRDISGDNECRLAQAHLHRREYGARYWHEDRIRSCLARVSSVLLLSSLSPPLPLAPSINSTSVTFRRAFALLVVRVF